MKKNLIKIFFIFSTLIFFTACSKNKDADKKEDIDNAEQYEETIDELYIFNSKGEMAEALLDVAKEYEKETKVKVKVYNTQAGENSVAALRSLMNQKVKPDIFSIRNASQMEEWLSYDYVLDLDSYDGLTQEFKSLIGNIPDTLKLSVSGKGSYGIPYNIEGYGYITNVQMIKDIFGENNLDKVLEDIRICSYKDWENLIIALGKYVESGKISTVSINNNKYKFQPKTNYTQNLTGIFSVAGANTWTYGNHMVNIAVCSTFKNAIQAQNATLQDVKKMKNALIAYAQALDLKTKYTAGDNDIIKRGSDMINSSINSYEKAIEKFANGKAIFFKNGNWTQELIENVNADMKDNMVFLPVKIPIKDSDISVEGLTSSQMNSTIPVFVPIYYAINAKNDDLHKKAAQDFLVWLNTSKTGQQYVIDKFKFIPYNSDDYDIKLDSSLANSIVEYVGRGNTLSNSFSGAPTNWSDNMVGKYILENYLIKEKWTKNDYEDIADYAINRWIDMAELE